MALFDDFSFCKLHDIISIISLLKRLIIAASMHRYRSPHARARATYDGYHCINEFTTESTQPPQSMHSPEALSRRTGR
jgi:hypothetical protein